MEVSLLYNPSYQLNLASSPTLMFPYNIQSLGVPTYPGPISHPILNLNLFNRLIANQTSLNFVPVANPTYAIPQQFAPLQEETLSSYYKLHERTVENEFKYPTLVAPLANKVATVNEFLDVAYEVKKQSLNELFPEPPKPLTIPTLPVHQDSLDQVKKDESFEKPAKRSYSRNSRRGSKKDIKPIELPSEQKEQSLEELMERKFIPEPITPEEAERAIKERYCSDSEEYQSVLSPFTQDFPGWHIDEIFTFMSKSKPIEIINMVKYLQWEKEERKRLEIERELLKIEKEKKEEEDDNLPKVRTRHWKKNEDNLKNENEKNELSLRLLKKGKNRSFMAKIKQILGLDEIDIPKAQQLLIQAEFDTKKFIKQIISDTHYYRKHLSVNK